MHGPTHPMTAMPGQGIDPAKMPGHWILARLGKRVLRPGGMEMTRRMLQGLAIDRQDHVVEFAPGMGATAQQVLGHQPASYTAIERDPAAAELVRHWLGANQTTRRVMNGQAQATGLPDGCATAVYGEAMLTMQTETVRRQIVAEAYRLLQPGGRYGIHELSLEPMGADAAALERWRQQVSQTIHHQAYPASLAQWRQLLEDQGFQVRHSLTLPMALLEPGRLIRDEGLLGAIRFAGRLLTHGPERKRVMQMRRVFRQLRPNLVAVGMVAFKPAGHPSAA